MPDGGSRPDGNGSAVFRMVSVERGFDNVDVSVTLRVDQMVSTKRTPEQDFDGVHIWVRYQSDRQLYAVSVDRRDDTMIIKKKCAGGTDNGGTYYDLNSFVTNAPIPFGQWQNVAVAVRNQPDGSVKITATRDGFEHGGHRHRHRMPAAVERWRGRSGGQRGTAARQDRGAASVSTVSR